jgi:hypothetical protein
MPSIQLIVIRLLKGKFNYSKESVIHTKQMFERLQNSLTYIAFRINFLRIRSSTLASTAVTTRFDVRQQ